MKIKKSQLLKIIKEELDNTVFDKSEHEFEHNPTSSFGDYYSEITKALSRVKQLCTETETHKPSVRIS